MFIVLEGIDGSGTTTQAKRLAELLSAKRPDEVATVVAEPTDSAIGKLIREQIKGTPYDWATMALLFSADRQQHSKTVIRPALGRNEHVIADRYHLSTLCYQLVSAVREEALPFWTGPMMRDWLRQLMAFCAKPDITIVLGVPVSVALTRLSARASRDCYEREDQLRAIAACYQRAQGLLGPEARVEYINADMPPEEVTHDIWMAVERVLRREEKLR